MSGDGPRRRVEATRDGDAGLRTATLVVLGLGAAAALAGLLWPAGNDLAGVTGLHGRGLYRRDTPFVAGGAQGSDLLSVLLVVPLGVWAVAVAGRRAGARLALIAVHAWWLYLSVSLAFGSVAFNELFPLYVALMPASALALSLALRDLALTRVPRGLPAFLAGCGVVTGTAWSILLALEMAAGAFPPDTYYTVRTTYAIDLGVIAPGCLLAGVALARGRRWGVGLALPLLCFAALLLPMMALQTVVQVRAGAAFGPESAAPFIGFASVSAGAIAYLFRLARSVRLDGSRIAAGGPTTPH